jgi:hypothetical protein
MAAWDKQKGETPKTFSHFCIYRDLGPERTLEKSAKIAGISWAQAQRLSDTYGWVQRCDQWDAQIRAIHDRAYLTQVAEDGKRRAQAFKALMNKCVTALNLFDPSIAKPKLNEIAAAMKAAAEGMRLEQGLSTANIAMEVSDARVIVSRLPAEVRSGLLRALDSHANAGRDSEGDRAVPLGISSTEDYSETPS